MYERRLDFFRQYSTSSTIMTPDADSDPFDDLLSLEDKFYKEGYDLGVADGERAGLVEGRLFGLERGFEKYAAMGKLHGRAIIWAGRLPEIKSQVDMESKGGEKKSATTSIETLSAQGEQDERTSEGASCKLRSLPANPRLESHIRTLYALTEPESLSTENNEDSVSDFDDRLKRAEGKMKIIERLTGEVVSGEMSEGSSLGEQGAMQNARTNKKGDGGIEDISSLHARH